MRSGEDQEEPVELVGPLPEGVESRELTPLPEQEWSAGNFRVEEFRVPLMKAVLQGPAEPSVATSEIPVDIGIQYLAGGGAGKLPVTLRSQIRTKTVPAPESFANFTFSNGEVKEGVTRRGSGEDEEPDVIGERGAPKIHQRSSATLDDAGTTLGAGGAS